MAMSNSKEKAAATSVVPGAGLPRQLLLPRIPTQLSASTTAAEDKEKQERTRRAQEWIQRILQKQIQMNSGNTTSNSNDDENAHQMIPTNAEADFKSSSSADLVAEMLKSGTALKNNSNSSNNDPLMPPDYVFKSSQDLQQPPSILKRQKSADINSAMLSEVSMPPIPEALFNSIGSGTFKSTASMQAFRNLPHATAITNASRENSSASSSNNNAVSLPFPDCLASGGSASAMLRRSNSSAGKPPGASAFASRDWTPQFEQDHVDVDADAVFRSSDSNTAANTKKTKSDSKWLAMFDSVLPSADSAVVAGATATAGPPPQQTQRVNDAVAGSEKATKSKEEEDASESSTDTEQSKTVVAFTQDEPGALPAEYNSEPEPQPAAAAAPKADTSIINGDLAALAAVAAAAESTSTRVGSPLPTKKATLPMAAKSTPPRSAKKRKAAAAPPPPEDRVYHVPKAMDVLLGRGGRTNHHAGNKKYLEAKDQIQERYMAASKNDKTAISQELVDVVHEWGGRFLQLDDETNQWFEVDNVKARKKASQTLREVNTAESRAKKRAKYGK